MKREYQCEVVAGKPQVATRDHHSAGRVLLHHKKQPELGPVRPGVRLPRAAAPTRSSTYQFVDDVPASIPREFIPACDKGFHEAIKKGSLIGFPVVGVPRGLEGHLSTAWTPSIDHRGARPRREPISDPF